jgi:carboxylesterase type B
VDPSSCHSTVPPTYPHQHAQFPIALKRMKQTTLLIYLLAAICQATSVTIKTTSGLLQGVKENGVMWFKGVRYADSAEARRWEPPVPFISSNPQNATVFGPSCVQQFPFDAPSLRSLLNSPPPPESEDCLFLNVWAPSSTTGPKKPVVFWMHGGGLSFGTASLPFYDGLSLASNQNIVVVTINYRC